MGVALLGQDAELVVDARVAERSAEEEAVELRLGERERALVLDRVLGREQEERVRQLTRHAVDGDLAARPSPREARTASSESLG